MNEIKIYLRQSKTIQIGGAKVIIRPPSNCWWLEAAGAVTEIMTSVLTYQITSENNKKAGSPVEQIPMRPQDLLRMFQRPSVKMLNLIAKTTNKRSWLPWRQPAHWFLTRLGPLETSIFLQAWLEAIGIEEIKQSLRKTGALISEVTGQRPARKPGSPEYSTGLQPPMAGQ